MKFTTEEKELLWKHLASYEAIHTGKHNPITRARRKFLEYLPWQGEAEDRS